MTCVTVLPKKILDLPPEIEDAINAGTLVTELDCTASEVVGDLVRLHASTPDLVERAIDNLVDRPIIGVIKEKISTVRCRVVVAGIIDYAIGVGRVYLGTDGQFTLTSPSNQDGYRQTLGYSFGNGKLNLDPNTTLTKNA